MATAAPDREILLARARARAELLKRRESLLDFIPRVSPHLEAPYHLGPYAAILERALIEPIKVVVAAPPQHGKTELLKHAVVRWLQKQPRRRHGYISYNTTRAEKVSLQMQWIATAARLDFDGTREDWYTPQGGGLLATGIGGGLTGNPIDGVCAVDDPVKNREEADSSTYRENTYDWFTSTAMTRVHPGASVVVMATRWHPEDLSGRLIADGWEYVNLPAVNANGEALWEAKRPRVWLDEKRKIVGEFDWNALYQGQPRGRGDSVFKEPTRYEAKPPQYKISIGADFAYSSKTYADYSVIVVLAHDPQSKATYVIDVYRGQVEAPEFQRELAARQERYGGTTTAFIGGTEKGIVDFMKRAGVRVNALPATQDKFTRAQAAAAAWNSGTLLVPKSAPWLEAFLAEVTAFTGIKDRHDDQVDALAGAFAPFVKTGGGRTVSGPGWGV